VSTVMPTVLKTASIVQSVFVYTNDIWNKQRLFQWISLIEGRLYDDKLCCSERGSGLLSSLWRNDDGRPLSITYPNIWTFSTQNAILYPIRMMHVHFLGAILFPGIHKVTLRNVLIVSVFIVSLHWFLSWFILIPSEARNALCCLSLEIKPN